MVIDAKDEAMEQHTALPLFQSKTTNNKTTTTLYFFIFFARSVLGVLRVAVRKKKIDNEYTLYGLPTRLSLHYKHFSPCAFTCFCIYIFFHILSSPRLAKNVNKRAATNTPFLLFNSFQTIKNLRKIVFVSTIALSSYFNLIKIIFEQNIFSHSVYQRIKT